jgi:hypothetical protein
VPEDWLKWLGSVSLLVLALGAGIWWKVQRDKKRPD